MAKITALIHAHDAGDAIPLARALDSLRPCDQTLVIDHSSAAEVAAVAREHGATVKAGVPGVSPGAYLVDARHDWILCVGPREALSEALEASLFQWKEAAHEAAEAFSVVVREQRHGTWHTLPAETRLTNRNGVNWIGDLPANDPHAVLLAGDLLRFHGDPYDGVAKPDSE